MSATNLKLLMICGTLQVMTGCVMALLVMKSVEIVLSPDLTLEAALAVAYIQLYLWLMIILSPARFFFSFAFFVCTLLYCATLYLATQHMLSTPFRFLDLPVELRLMVYEHLLRDEYGLRYVSDNSNDSETLPHYQYPLGDSDSAGEQYKSIRQTCHSIRNETWGVPFLANRLVFDCEGPDAPESAIEQCLAWIRDYTPAKHRHITEIVILEYTRSNGIDTDRFLRLHDAGRANPRLDITLVSMECNHCWVNRLAAWHRAHPWLPVPLSFKIREYESVFPRQRAYKSNCS